jgi:transposase
MQAFKILLVLHLKKETIKFISKEKRCYMIKKRKFAEKSVSVPYFRIVFLIISKRRFFPQSISQIISRFSNRNNTNNLGIMEKKWYVGIDISKKTLDVVVFDIGNSRSNENYLKTVNDVSGFRELSRWFKSKKMRFEDIVVCMEYTGIYGYNIRKFFEQKSIDYCMETPVRIKKSLGLARGKSDRIDAFRIARYCYIHREFLGLSRLPGSTILRLQQLLAERGRYVKHSACYKQVLSELSLPETKAFAARTKNLLDKTRQVILAVEKQMRYLIESDASVRKNFELLTSIIGIGMVNAVTTIVHTENFISFDNARQYACYVSVAPFEHSSGSSIRGRTAVSRMGDRQAKADLTEGAKAAIVHDSELRLYYERKKKQGKAHGVILNAVKFKLIERMFAVVRRGTPFVRLNTYST